MNQNLLLQAFAHYQSGRLEPAAELLRQYLNSSALDGPANHILGGIYYRQGKFTAARDHLARACAVPGATAEMLNNLGAALKALGDGAGATAAYQRALTADPNYAEALNNLAVMYREQGDSRKAIELLRRVVMLKPGFPEAQKNLRNAYADVVPAWHFAMVNDRARNNAYEAAIARAAPGKRVLDIGTGTGLLAMMAARAGARSVTTCEATPVIAELAFEIVSRNGFGDRIEIISRHSTALAAGRELHHPAEVLVTEIFSSDLLSEGVLPTIEHAHRALLAPGAVLVPRAASARAYLAGGSEIEDMLFAGPLNGFDLSQFNELAPPILAASMNNVSHDVLSHDFELFTFDLHRDLFGMESRTLAVPVTRTGRVSAVVQWIHLELDETARYENRPASGPEAESHWTHILYRVPRPIPVSAGDTVHLLVGHNREQIWIRPAA